MTLLSIAMASLITAGLGNLSEDKIRLLPEFLWTEPCYLEFTWRSEGAWYDGAQAMENTKWSMVETWGVSITPLPNGNAEDHDVRLTFERFAATFRRPEADATFDSDADLKNRSNDVARYMGPVIGRTIHLTLDVNGRLLGVEGAEEVQSVAVNPPETSVWRQWAASQEIEPWVRFAWEMLIQIYPVTPVSPGETWQGESTQGELEYDMEFELSAITGGKQAQVDFDFDGREDTSPQQNSDGSTWRNVSNKGHGVAEIEIHTGRLLRFEDIGESVREWTGTNPETGKKATNRNVTKHWTEVKLMTPEQRAQQRTSTHR